MNLAMNGAGRRLLAQGGRGETRVQDRCKTEDKKFKTKRVGRCLRPQGAVMPSYQNVTPPSSLFSGDVGFSYNNETFPGSAQAGSQFALPSFTGLPDGGTAVRWQTIFGTAPTAVNLTLQGAMSDIDAEYQIIDTTTLTT